MALLPIEPHYLLMVVCICWKSEEAQLLCNNKKGHWLIYVFWKLQFLTLGRPLWLPDPLPTPCRTSIGPVRLCGVFRSVSHMQQRKTCPLYVQQWIQSSCMSDFRLWSPTLTPTKDLTFKVSSEDFLWGHGLGVTCCRMEGWCHHFSESLWLTLIFKSGLQLWSLALSKAKHPTGINEEVLGGSFTDSLWIFQGQGDGFHAKGAEVSKDFQYGTSEYLGRSKMLSELCASENSSTAVLLNWVKSASHFPPCFLITQDYLSRWPHHLQQASLQICKTANTAYH